jgi:uncharacterized protein (DUF433 family)
MSELHRITVDLEQCGSRPCIRGLGITVTVVLNLLAEGATRAEIFLRYPALEAGDITAALEYGAIQCNQPVLGDHVTRYFRQRRNRRGCLGKLERP